MSAASLTTITTTVRPGAHLILVRAPSGPRLTIASVRTITSLTRRTGTCLTYSGAISSPVVRRPLGYKTSFIVRTAAGCLTNRDSMVKKTIVTGALGPLFRRLELVRKLNKTVPSPFSY